MSEHDKIKLIEETLNYCKVHTKIDPLQLQIGGSHYKDMPVQPAEFCEKNGLSHLESNVVKRMCRWKTRGKPLEDLRKAKHEIDLLIEIHEVKE